MISSSSYITLTVVTENRTYTSKAGCDNLTYPADGLFNKRLLNKDISSFRELFDIIYDAYDGIYTECEIIQELETSELSEIKKFSEVNEIILEDEVSGDISYFELEMNPNVEDPNDAMKIIEKYNFKTKEYSRKRYIENCGKWGLLDEIELSDRDNTSTDNDSLIPKGTTEIEPFAFCEDTTLTNITIPDSVVSIGKNAFEGCKNLSSVNIGSGVINIDDYAFSGCISLKEIIIPDNVNRVGYAFEACESLKDITIGKGVTSISGFEGCKSLVNLNVDESNKNYCSIDGNLFSKNKKVLIQYAIGKRNKSYTVPNDVTNIDIGAFAGCRWLKSITLPDSMTTIGDWAFYGCKSLTSITIPGSVTSISIGDNTFRECKKPIICGSKGSYAEQFAKKYLMPFKEI